MAGLTFPRWFAVQARRDSPEGDLAVEILGDVAGGCCPPLSTLGDVADHLTVHGLDRDRYGDTLDRLADELARSRCRACGDLQPAPVGVCPDCARERSVHGAAKAAFRADRFAARTPRPPRLTTRRR